jgi:hypothetical protein
LFGFHHAEKLPDRIVTFAAPIAAPARLPYHSRCRPVILIFTDYCPAVSASSPFEPEQTLHQGFAARKIR